MSLNADKCSDWTEEQIRREWKHWGRVEREIYKDAREIALELGEDRLDAARFATWRVLFNRRFMGIAPAVVQAVEEGRLTYGQSRIRIGSTWVVVDERFKHAAKLVAPSSSRF